MATLSKTSKETLSIMIRNEFDNIDFTLDYIYGKAKELIQTAKELGLDELAQEMTNDIN